MHFICRQTLFNGCAKDIIIKAWAVPTCVVMHKRTSPHLHLTRYVTPIVLSSSFWCRGRTVNLSPSPSNLWQPRDVIRNTFPIQPLETKRCYQKGWMALRCVVTMSGGQTEVTSPMSGSRWPSECQPPQVEVRSLLANYEGQCTAQLSK